MLVKAIKFDVLLSLFSCPPICILNGYSITKILKTMCCAGYITIIGDTLILIRLRLAGGLGL